MKRLLLVANTGLDDLELAISKAGKKLKKKGLSLDWELLFSRSTHAKVRGKNLLVMLGPSTYVACQDIVDNEVVGIIMGDPMNLNCIQGDNVKRVDFEPRGDGFGFLYTKPTLGDISQMIIKAVRAKVDDKPVTVEALRFIPGIINGATDTVTFVADFASLSYSIKSELGRNKIKRAFISWIDSEMTVEQLGPILMNACGMKKRSPRIENIQKTLTDHPNIRRGLKAILAGIRDKKPVNLDKLAATHKVSAYDYSYMSSLMKKDNFIIAEDTSENVHRRRAKARFVEDDDSDAVSTFEGEGDQHLIADDESETDEDV